MARITGNIFDYEINKGNAFSHAINKGIMIPPIGFLGVQFPHISAIATERSFREVDTIILKWRVKGSDTIHTYNMPDRELTMDEITTILVALRMS